MKNKILMAFVTLTSFTQAADLNDIFDLEAHLKPTYKDTGPTGIAIILAPEIEKRLIQPENIEKILDLGPTYHFSSESYDYLYFNLSLLGDFGFEDIWHGAKLARKKTDEKDWTKCELYSPVSFYPIDLLNELKDEEIMGITNEHHSKKHVELTNLLHKLKTTQEQLEALKKSRAQPVGVGQ
ncbi:MAG: hypothetical protein ACSHX8_16060 [Opitutaceae bacterium]